MAILIDYSQCSTAALMTLEGLNTFGAFEERQLRHLVLNSIRQITKTHRPIFGSEVVIACDSEKYWRKQMFPAYKANRKKKREISGLDWNEIHRVFRLIRDEITETFPYKVVNVEGAEADDVIAVIAKHIASSDATQDGDGLGLTTTQNRVLIVSSDNDFFQLHVHPNIQQFSNTKKEFLTVADPVAFLKEKIIRGEAKDKDGIPNITSPDEIFLTEERQKAITDKVLTKYMGMSVDELLRTTYFGRNRELIDFAFIPKDLQAKIMETYNAATPKPRNKIFDYLVKHQLSELVKHLGDF